MDIKKCLYFAILTISLDQYGIVHRIPKFPRFVHGEYTASDYLFIPLALVVVTVFTKAGLDYLNRHPKAMNPMVNLIMSLILSLCIGYLSSLGAHDLLIEYPNYKLSTAPTSCEKGTFYKVHRSSGRGGSYVRGVLFLNKNGKETSVSWGKPYHKKISGRIPVDVKLKRGLIGGLFVVDYGENICGLTPPPTPPKSRW